MRFKRIQYCWCFHLRKEKCVPAQWHGREGTSLGCMCSKTKMSKNQMVETYFLTRHLQRHWLVDQHTGGLVDDSRRVRAKQRGEGGRGGGGGGTASQPYRLCVVNSVNSCHSVFATLIDPGDGTKYTYILSYLRLTDKRLSYGAAMCPRPQQSVDSSRLCGSFPVQRCCWLCCAALTFVSFRLLFPLLFSDCFGLFSRLRSG